MRACRLSMSSLLGRLLLVSFLQTASSQNACPPLGPVLPAPLAPSSNKGVQAVIAGIQSLAGSLTPSFNATAISIEVTSIHETKPMLSYNWTPPILNKTGAHKVTDDTVYHLASVTKLYTAFALLLLSDKINLADPVTKYVPELRQVVGSPVNDITSVQWDMVTIEALASHLGGVGQEMGMEDLANTPGPYASLGLPALDSNASTQCGGAYNEKACTRADFFKYFGQRHPVYAPFTSPVYSNIAYSILGFVIEAVTNKTYAEYMQEAVFEPLNLTHTTVGPPADHSTGFIPADKNWFGTPEGLENPGGGIYASTTDVLAFGVSILKSTLLTPLQTRAWMKPKTFTSSFGTSLGLGWEILRSDNVTADGRIIDFYTKTGGLYDFNSVLAVVPDYDLVIAVNMAGPQASQGILFALVTQLVWALVPAIEAAGKAEAKVKYAGTYHASTAGKVTGTITLAIDDGPGLVVSDYTSNGHGILKEWPQLVPGSDVPSARMYPTNLQAGDQMAWRAVYDFYPGNGYAAADSQLFFPQGSCETWSELDLTSYGLRSLDDFVFTFDAQGNQTTAVTARALRSTMERVG